MPESSRDKGANKPNLLQEFLDQLEHISQRFPGSRLLVDMARDAGLEMVRTQNKRISRARTRMKRAEAKRHDLQSRLSDLLHELSTSSATLPLSPGQPQRDPEPFVVRFQQLRDDAYPALAQILRDQVGRGSRKAFIRFLSEEVFFRAAPIIAEHQLRHAHRPWTAEHEKSFHADLRQHVVGKVNRALARTANIQVSPTLGRHLDALIGSSLEVLEGLMTATPQVRLVVPAAGSPIDPEAHHGLHPEKGGEKPVVGAILFPGLIVLEQPPRVIEQALVQVLPGKSRRKKKEK